MTPERTIKLLGLTGLFLAFTEGLTALLRLMSGFSWVSSYGLGLHEYIALYASALLLFVSLRLLRRSRRARPLALFYAFSVIALHAGAALLALPFALVQTLFSPGASGGLPHVLTWQAVEIPSAFIRLWFPVLLLGFMAMPSMLEALGHPAPGRIHAPRLTPFRSLGAVCVLMGAAGLLSFAGGILLWWTQMGLTAFQSGPVSSPLFRIGLGADLLILIAGIGLLRCDYWARLVAMAAVAVQLFASTFHLALYLLGFVYVAFDLPFLHVVVDHAARLIYGKQASAASIANPNMLYGLPVITYLLASLAFPVLLLVFMRATHAEEAIDPSSLTPAEPPVEG